MSHAKEIILQLLESSSLFRGCLKALQAEHHANIKKETEDTQPTKFVAITYFRLWFPRRGKWVEEGVGILFDRIEPRRIRRPDKQILLRPTLWGRTPVTLSTGKIFVSRIPEPPTGVRLLPHAQVWQKTSQPRAALKQEKSSAFSLAWYMPTHVTKCNTSISLRVIFFGKIYLEMNVTLCHTCVTSCIAM